ncbi:MAG: hypothetical protein IJA94_01785 [Bacilli bacterium]|nr:hypothetical protein [Bacilli bacterium]
MQTENRINKNVQMLFIISLVILEIRFLLNLLNSFKEDKSFLLTLISLGLLIIFIICFILFIIFLIINMLNTKDKKIKLKLVSMIGSISLMLGLVSSININITNVKKKEFINEITKIANKVKKDDLNKFVYKLEDLQQLDKTLKESPYNLLYQDSSYISNFDNEIYVCISDGKHKVEGTLDNLKYNEPLTNRNCEFSFSNKQAEIYVSYKLAEKYQREYEVINCQKKVSSPLGTSFSLDCNVKEKNTNNEFKVTLNNDLVIIDRFIFSQIEDLLRQHLNPLIQNMIRNNNYYITILKYNYQDENKNEITLNNLVNKCPIDFSVDIYADISENQLNQLANNIGKWMIENQIYGEVIFRKKDINNNMILAIELEITKDRQTSITKSFERKSN